jgi:uncharacterized membrane protein YsdA (DUF1294 family)
VAPAPSRDRPAPAARGDGAVRASAAKAPRAGAGKAKAGAQMTLELDQLVKGGKRKPAVKLAVGGKAPARGDGGGEHAGAAKPRAKRPAPRRQAARSGAAGASGSGSYLAIVVLLVLYLIATLQWRLSTWAAVAYGALSLVCFILYAIDKSAAVNGRWRTPESTLHLLALAGGWPGAILAQQWLRHKSSKLAFRIVFWCTVALNMGAFMWLARWLQRHA